MTLFAPVGSSAEAFGHPSECTEPAPGEVVSTSSQSVSVDNNDFAVAATADIHFDSHGHGTTDGSCDDFQSHDVDPTTVSSTVSINGEGIYIVGDGVGTDPTTGGDIDIIDSDGNNTVRVT